MNRRTKRYITRCVAILLAIFIVPVTLCIFAFSLPCVYGDTFLGELKFKYARLTDADGARIVVVGGSGVAFGQFSELMEENMSGYTVVNFGMYAALGTKVMLDLSRPHIRRGDIVIVSPEQTPQTLSCYFNGEAMWQALDGAFGMMNDLDKDDRRKLLGRFPSFAADKFGYALKNATPAPDGVYRRASFNEYGDIVCERPHNIMTKAYDATTPVQLTADTASDDFVEELNAYARACTEKGAKIFYRFCPMNAAAVKGDAAAYFDAFADRLIFPVLGDPHASLMEREWFYDTNFHLNDAGALLNTRNIVRSLKAELKDSSPTLIEAPQKPALTESEEYYGNDAHAQYFVGEKEADGVKITGLTDAGKRMTRLIVPTHIDGMPVREFTAATFAENEIVREIVVQDNITHIENGAFRGCKALETLRMTSLKPSRCAVGNGLAAGAEFTIRVPASALSAYKTDYFWSVYAEMIYAED